MKKVIALVLAAVLLCAALGACTSGGGSADGADDDASAENEAEKGGDGGVFHLGDTWTVDGLWSVTVNAVEELSERAEDDELNPEAVYRIDYTYENLGFEDEILGGLYIFINSYVTDAAGEAGYAYPGEIQNAPVFIGVGETCEAQDVVGVNHAGTFEIHFDEFDTDYNEYKATFIIEV